MNFLRQRTHEILSVSLRNYVFARFTCFLSLNLNLELYGTCLQAV